MALDCDADGTRRVVCTRSIRGRPALLVLEAKDGRVLALSELGERRPRRVAGLALLPKRRALLADLAADCLRLHTYW